MMSIPDLSAMPPILSEFIGYILTIRGKSEKTATEYYLDLRTFFRFLKQKRGLVPSSVPFEDISIEDVDLEFVKSIKLTDAYEFLTYCSAQRGNQAASRARKCCAIRNYFKYLTLKVGKLSVNPMEQLESPKSKRALPKYLTLDQSKDLLSAVDGTHKERDYCILTLFLNCGLRLSELCGLNLSDLQDNTVTVTGKGNKQRVVYLNDACLNALKVYLPVRARDMTVVKDKNALFLSRLGNRISNKTVQHIVYETLEKAGLGGRGLSVHKLRHTAATLMYQHGHVDIRVLKDVLGHENLGTTEIYTHLSAQQLENAANANPLADWSAPKKRKEEMDPS